MNINSNNNFHPEQFGHNQFLPFSKSKNNDSNSFTSNFEVPKVDLNSNFVPPSSASIQQNNAPDNEPPKIFEGRVIIGHIKVSNVPDGTIVKEAETPWHIKMWNWIKGLF